MRRTWQNTRGFIATFVIVLGTGLSSYVQPTSSLTTRASSRLEWSTETSPKKWVSGGLWQPPLSTLTSSHFSHPFPIPPTLSTRFHPFPLDRFQWRPPLNCAEKRQVAYSYCRILFAFDTRENVEFLNQDWHLKLTKSVIQKYATLHNTHILARLFYDKFKISP